MQGPSLPSYAWDTDTYCGNGPAPQQVLHGAACSVDGEVGEGMPPELLGQLGSYAMSYASEILRGGPEEQYAQWYTVDLKIVMMGGIGTAKGKDKGGGGCTIL